MQLIFTEHYDQLKEKLSSIEGEWDESQPNKKVLRLNGGVMNWYESTFTIQFQGKQEPKSVLEKLVLSALNPERKQSTEELYRKEKPESQKDKQEPITQTNQNVATKYLNDEFEDSEIIIGIVSAVGTETPRVITPLTDRLKHFGYVAEEIKVSSLLRNGDSQSEYERIKSLMEAGDNCRKTSNNNAILSYGAAKLINEKRNESKAKRAFIVNSLKHPDEVEALRKIYGQGFYLLGIHADKKRRLHYLINDKDLTDEQAIELTEIDEDEKVTHGQRTRDTYHLSDFFINFGKNDDQVKILFKDF
jgi:hypothetical protein